MKKSTSLLLVLVLTGMSNLFAQQTQVSPAFVMQEGTCTGTPPSAPSEDDRDGNGSLGQTYNMTKCGLNYVYASRLITTRSASPNIGSGFPANLAIAGIPAGVVIEKAYVYWILSYHTGSSVTPTLVLTNPLGVTNNYAGALIGQAGPKCWGETGTRAFRSDVTAAVAGNGNYVINNIIGLLPWNGQPAWEIDGATLVIIYSDASASFKGTMVINDGIITLIAVVCPPITLNNFNTCANTIYLDGFTITADQQANINPPTHQSLINNILFTFPNNFWNTDHYIIPTTTTGCQTSSVFGNTPHPNDCYSICCAAFYFQEQSVPGCSPFLLLTTNFQDPNCGLMDGTASVVASNGAAPYTYLWSNSANTAAISNLGPGTYTVTVTDACACLTGTASVTLVNLGAPMVINTTTVDLTCYQSNDGSATATVLSGGNPPYTYSWNTVPPQNTPTANNLPGGTYTVVSTDSGGCTATTTVIINEPTAVTLNLQNINQTLCALNNGSAEAVGAGGTGTISYLWNTAPVQTSAIASNLSPGTYTVTVTDANGCSISTSVTINPSTIPVVTPVITGPDPICISQSTQLDANVGGGTPPYNYNWWTPPVGLSATNIKSPIASPVITTTFTVDVTDVNGCLSQPNTVTVQVYNPLIVTPVGSTAICVGGNAAISVSGMGGDGNYTFSWDNGDTGTGPISVSPVVTTTYTVILTDGCNSPLVSGSVTITVSPTPVVDFQFIDVTNCQPYVASFSDESSVTSPSVITNWLWSFGDGGNSNEQHAAHGYLSGGTYTIGLTVTTNDGCSATDSIQQAIDVAPEYSFYIPNAFSPNGDNINEMWFPKGLSVKEYSLKIYD
ncbi:MAG TPA: PKD domain-containing protein, partial [Bacteroidia bacterium]|nr:PKD domain-containing protein [Bacteroidia bacterium]